MDNKVDSVIYGYYRFDQGKIIETSPPIFQEGLYSGKQILQDIAPRFIGISEENINALLRREENALYVENPELWRILV